MAETNETNKTNRKNTLERREMAKRAKIYGIVLPSEMLYKYMVSRKISPKKLASQIGIFSRELEMIMTGIREIDEPLAKKIEKATNISYKSWLDEEMNYQIAMEQLEKDIISGVATPLADAEEEVDATPTKSYKLFMKRIIEKYKQLIPGSETLSKYLKADPKDKEFGTSVERKTIAGYDGFYFSYLPGAKVKKRRKQIILEAISKLTGEKLEELKTQYLEEQDISTNQAISTNQEETKKKETIQFVLDETENSDFHTLNLQERINEKQSKVEENSLDGQKKLEIGRDMLRQEAIAQIKAEIRQKMLDRLLDKLIDKTLGDLFDKL